MSTSGLTPEADALTLVIPLKAKEGLSLDDFYEYWLNAHVILPPRFPGISDIWLHAVSFDSQTWPRTPGISHRPAPEDDFHGVPEATFPTMEDLGAFQGASRVQMEDGINFLSQQIAYCSFGANTATELDDTGVPAPDGHDAFSRHLLFLRRRDDVSIDDFRAWVVENLAPSLAASSDVIKVRRHLFEQLEVTLDHPGVEMSKPLDRQYQAMVDVVVADDASRRHGRPSPTRSARIATPCTRPAWSDASPRSSPEISPLLACAESPSPMPSVGSRRPVSSKPTCRTCSFPSPPTYWSSQLPEATTRYERRRRTMTTASYRQSADPGRVDSDLRATLVGELAGEFVGELIGPDDAGYDSAREVWNAMVDKRPGLIARCTSTSDVVAIVKAAARHGLSPSVRCGGHNVAGKSLSEGGLTIDLGTMRGVVVDIANKLVYVDGGCRLGDVDAATGQHGLIVPAGIMSETGVAGLALGGGIGWFSRKHGLTCDQFVELEVVLASGEVVVASATEHPDLFWGLKGGGGNFGIVTRFTFQGFDFGPMMRIGVSLYKPEDAVEALRQYASVYPTLGRNVGWHAALKHDMPVLPFVPPELVGERLLMLISMWLEDAEDPAGIELIDRLGTVGNPCVTTSTVLPFGAGVQHIIDEEFADGHRYYTKEAHVSQLSDEAIDVLYDFWKDMPMHGEVEIIGLGGAIEDIDEGAAAFSNRSYQMWLNFAMSWDDRENDADYIARTRAAVDLLKPWVGTGVYVNMLNFDEMDRVVEAYGAEKYARLARVKTQYDPTNLFRINANILPG
jgi:FAD/FMN-containing dehydrogenase